MNKSSKKIKYYSFSLLLLILILYATFIYKLQEENELALATEVEKNSAERGSTFKPFDHSFEKGLKNLKKELIFDKMFQNILKPTKLEPFHFEMKGLFEPSDITLTTMITVDRFDILLNCMTIFDGLFSVALHIAEDSDLSENLEKLKIFISKNREFIETRLDIHLVVDKFPRQLNYLRNVARFFSRTDLILPLDVDFMINKSFIKHVKSNDFIFGKLLNGEAVFIIPAFEYHGVHINTTYESFPQEKKDVIKLFKEEKLMIFHGTDNKGHTSTNYTMWMNTTDPYRIEPNSFSYEPYAIFNKNTVPWSDERFIGYGGNKAAWWYEIYLAGLEFWVVPNDFLIHQYHKYDDSVRLKEVRKQKKIVQT
ncbi:hypothetical protein HDU92_003439 [Lobulomyces angularis]|nr:hypothetical protein HDU92_003439 [Lobulomyces angularis]